jgi:PucR family transcriptional regulator, purine catabolism regulatory protein
MLPTLRALCDSLPSELAVIAPSPAPAVEVQAVHVSELLQPARYLDGGELLITSGMNIPPTAEACATYTRQLAHANVAALAFGTGVIHPDVPRLLIQGATAAGLPLLRVLPGTAYLTITRKYWQLRAESDQRELVRTLNSHRALVAAALGDGGESAIVRRLAAGIPGWTAQYSPTGDLLHVWPSDQRSSAVGLSSELRDLRIVNDGTAISLTTSDANIIIHPLSSASGLLGSVAIGCTEPATPAVQQLAMTAASLLTLKILHSRGLRRARREGTLAIFELLIAGNVSGARRVWAMSGQEAPQEPVRPVLLRGPQVSDFVEALESGRDCGDHLLMSAEMGWLGWLLLNNTPAAREWLRAKLDPVVRVGALLGSVTPFDDLPAMMERLEQSEHRITDGGFTDLSAQPGSLLSQIDDIETRHWAQQRLGPLTDPAHRTLLVSVISYLRARGEWEPAARELGVHRHTMRSRIARATEVLNVEFTDTDTFSELWLALRIAGYA